MINTPEPPYALFHVHRVTGERRRYPRHSFPAGTKQDMEWRAQDRYGTAGEWVTEAHPDEPVKLAYYIHPESSSAFIDTDPLEGSDGLVERIGEVGAGGPSREDFLRVAEAVGLHDSQHWADLIDYTRFPTA